MATLTEQAIDLLAYLDKNAKPGKKPNEPPTVSELLAQSRAAHLVYRRSLRHRANGVVVDGNPEAAAEALATSARLRAQAEVQDPRHVEDAWADDLKANYPHTALLEFYGSEVKVLLPPLAKPVDTVPIDPKPVDDSVTVDGPR